jgi:hypothetical protein
MPAVTGDGMQDHAVDERGHRSESLGAPRLARVALARGGVCRNDVDDLAPAPAPELDGDHEATLSWLGLSQAPPKA